VGGKVIVIIQRNLVMQDKRVYEKVLCAYRFAQYEITESVAIFVHDFADAI